MKNWLIAFFAVLIIFSSCSESKEPETDGAQITDQNGVAVKKTAPRKVRTEKVKPGDVTGKIFFNAIIEAQRDVTVNSKMTGEVVQMNFDIGSFVRKGDTIAAVEFDIQKAALDQAELNLKQAELNLGLKERVFARDKNLFENKAMSTEGFEISENGYKTAELALNQAKTALSTAVINYNNCFIKAPFDGIIVERPVQLGQYVTIGSIIARIVDTANLQVIVGLTYHDLLTYKKYKNKNIDIVLPDGSIAPGLVKGVADAPDKKTGLYSMKVLFNSVKNEENKYVVFPGMQLQVAMNGEVYKNAFLTSRNNIRLLGSKYSVYILENGTAVEKEVEIISDTGSLRIVRLADGTGSSFKMIVSGVDALVDGKEVEEVETK